MRVGRCTTRETGSTTSRRDGGQGSTGEGHSHVVTAQRNCTTCRRKAFVQPLAYTASAMTPPFLSPPFLPSLPPSFPPSLPPFLPPSSLLSQRSGNVYEGEWHLNKRHGRGTMHWYDRREQYSGQWAHGIQHGQGEHVWIMGNSDHAQVYV